MTAAVHLSVANNSTCYASRPLRFFLTSNEPPHKAMHPHQSRSLFPETILSESNRDAPSTGSGSASGLQQASLHQPSDPSSSLFPSRSSQPRVLAPYPPIPEAGVSPSFRPPELRSTEPAAGLHFHSPNSRPSLGAPTSIPAAGTSHTFPAYTTLNSQSSGVVSRAIRGVRQEPALMGTLQTAQSSTIRRKRCSLFIRQQPRAARAGPDGKDRRPIDPPPILQLLMDDFDATNEEDVAEIKSPWWVVHCRLVGAESPELDVSTLHYFRDDGRKELQRLLLGTTVANPTPTQDDPDPETMPQHPKTPPAPPSPTSRFIPNPSSNRREAPPIYGPQIPGCFFIFADLSIRRAGDYRLQFNLMKMDPALLTPGSLVHCIDTTTSAPFRVVNAKDFDQIQPSTNLVKGLLERGAGFPLKLKKGQREGHRRRRQHSGDESDEDSYYDEN